MVPKVLLFCLGLALVPLSAVAQAQPPNANPVTLDDLAKLISNLQTQVGELKTQNVQLERDINELRELHLNQVKRFEDIIKEDAHGNYQLTAKFQRAIQMSAPTHGELVIRNRMPTDQNLLVNGEQFLVLAGGTLRIRVPRGLVTTKLSGQEPRHWTVGAPDYTQSFDIRPRETTSTATGWVSNRSYEPAQPLQANPWPWNGYIIVR